MRYRTILFLIILGCTASFASAAGPQTKKAATDTCFDCHSSQETKEAKAFENDVHRSMGLSCSSCHGGDPTAEEMDAAMDPKKGFIGVPKATQIPQLCAKCHSDPAYMKKFKPDLPVDQYEKYVTSVHGKRNAEGDPKVATCISCHSTHSIFQVKDPRSPVYVTNIPDTCGKCHADKKYMAEYKIPTDQLQNYKASVHGIALLKKSDLSAPACNSCHGNHGATPPGITSIANVCGSCHPSNEELFQKSPHQETFAAMDLPGCVTCHGNHLVAAPTDSMVGLDQKSNCGGCHTATDPAGKTAMQMREVLDRLTKGVDQAQTQLTRAEQLGMDVSEAKYSLKDVNQALIQSRVKVHTFSLAPVTESANPAFKILSDAKEAAMSAVKEYYFRRKGLGISTLILTFLVALLYLKIKNIEQKQENSGKDHPRKG
jgi:predicted CXXCH cytochrome family protein